MYFNNTRSFGSFPTKHKLACLWNPLHLIWCEIQASIKMLHNLWCLSCVHYSNYFKYIYHQIKVITSIILQFSFVDVFVKNTKLKLQKLLLEAHSYPSLPKRMHKHQPKIRIVDMELYSDELQGESISTNSNYFLPGYDSSTNLFFLLFLLFYLKSTRLFPISRESIWDWFFGFLDSTDSF